MGFLFYPHPSPLVLHSSLSARKPNSFYISYLHNPVLIWIPQQVAAYTGRLHPAGRQVPHSSPHSSPPSHLSSHYRLSFRCGLKTLIIYWTNNIYLWTKDYQPARPQKRERVGGVCCCGTLGVVRRDRLRRGNGAGRARSTVVSSAARYLCFNVIKSNRSAASTDDRYQSPQLTTLRWAWGAFWMLLAVWDRNRRGLRAGERGASTRCHTWHSERAGHKRARDL